jgi:hypothetical protein
VEIGELTLEIVPIKSENFDEIGSEIVKNLACAFIQQAIIPDRRSHASNEYLKPPSLPSIICPGRYLNCVADATERWERREESRRVMALGGKDAIACVLDVSRPDDVREVVRAFFLRTMVVVRQSGLGYGDFLIWCGYDVNPLDPVLFWYVSLIISKLISEEVSSRDCLKTTGMSASFQWIKMTMNLVVALASISGKLMR